MRVRLLVLLTTLFVLTSGKPGTRIIGGQDARAGQFPYAAALYIQGFQQTTFCGGTLISNQWVLTAGHCIYGSLTITVQLGSIYLTEPDPNRATLVSDEIHIHPDFDPITYAHDIGALEFRMAVSLTDYIKPTNFFPIDELYGSATVTTFGWGQDSDSSSGLVSHLQYVSLSAISNEECRLVYGGTIVDSMVCATGNYNEGLCIGDSGSPLIQTVGGGNVLIVGIGSFSSTNGCESTDPSGFTRVFPYKAWIANVTGVI